MRRKVFNFATAISLLLCAAMAVLCAVSLVREESFGWVGSHVTFKVAASRGVVVFKVRLLLGYETYKGESLGYSHYSQSSPSDLEWYGMHSIGSHGFGYFYMAGMATSGHWTERWLLLPGWLVVILLAWMPLSWRYLSGRNWILEYRAQANLCLACGYSLTGNTSGICPECGVPVPTMTEAAI